MDEARCSLCAAGSKTEMVAGALIHEVENMSEDGKPELVVCADSAFKPKGRTVAPKILVNMAGLQGNIPRV